MVCNKSLDEFELIAALLHDAHLRYGEVFNTRALRNTLKVLKRRYRLEGIGLLTKSLSRLDKHICHVLAGSTKLNPTSVGFTTIRGSKLPRFLGELFSLVFRSDGTLLPNPDADCVRMIRDILCCFYKYKLPYQDKQEQKVIDDFIKAEDELSTLTSTFAEMRLDMLFYNESRASSRRLVRLGFLNKPDSEMFLKARILTQAKELLNRVFLGFDPYDITPSHGPGVVATKQQLWEKFLWTNVAERITNKYPFDAYFCASLGHVSDSFTSFEAVKTEDLPAQVILVPKDARGPRLISCEPVDFQWIQQGLMRAIVDRVESHNLTKYSVFFTNQVPNQKAALLGSHNGKYATLDLKEASDRVHLDLVRLIFPEPLLGCMEATRSLSTRLPDGRTITLNKFAPMGSALCFPVMALTIWSILTAAILDAYDMGMNRDLFKRHDLPESIHVYGDDVIVPTAYAESAMTVLELFGLKINQSKSCTNGSFRESCGVDAFKGVNVTPVRLRTVWDESPRPDVYTSWISYANAYWDRQYYTTYEYIVARLIHIYGPIPDAKVCKNVPHLRVAPAEHGSFKWRWNKNLQKRQYFLRTVTSPSVNHEIDGWSMLLRYFTEAQRPSTDLSVGHSGATSPSYEEMSAFSVSRYTKRHTSKLVWRWR